MKNLTKTHLIKILADSIEKHGDGEVIFELLGNSGSASFKIHDSCDNDNIHKEFNISRLSLVCDIDYTPFRSNFNKLSKFIKEIDDWK